MENRQLKEQNLRLLKEVQMKKEENDHLNFVNFSEVEQLYNTSTSRYEISGSIVNSLARNYCDGIGDKSWGS